MSTCVCQRAEQMPLPCHVLVLSCPSREFAEHSRRLIGLGYEKIGGPEIKNLADSHRSWATSHWLRYDARQDPWFEAHAPVIHAILEWLSNPREAP